MHGSQSTGALRHLVAREQDKRCPEACTWSYIFLSNGFLELVLEPV